MTRRELRHFAEARRQALESDFARQRVGCVIVCGNRLLAAAHNSERTHTAQKKYNAFRDLDQSHESVEPKVHAEISALSKSRYADVDWGKAEVYVWRETKDGKKCGLARPCAGCMAALRERGIRRVYYTGNDSLVYEYLDMEGVC